MAKVLVVDDEPGMRQVVLNVLKTEGHQLFAAEDGRQAIEIAKREHPNLVMLDMRLPDMDGLEILAEIKKIYPDTVVIMLSGFGDVESAVGAMKQGAFDYLSKPFKVNEVIAIAKKALASQALSKEGTLKKSGNLAAASAQTTSTAGKGFAGLVKFALIGLVVAAVIGGGVFFAMNYLGGAKSEVYSVAYSNPTSLAFDGKYLWVTDWVTQSFYQHNINKTLTTAHQYYLQDSNPTGVTYDGKYIWSSNSMDSAIFKHDLNDNLKVITRYNSPCAEPSGLYWDGAYLWICGMKEGKIYQTKPSEDGLQTVKTYDSPGTNPVGIFSDGKNYWVGDSDTNMIYKLDRDFKVIDVYSTPQFEKANSTLTGMAWDGKMIWTCSDGNQKIYRNSFKSLKKKQF